MSALLDSVLVLYQGRLAGSGIGIEGCYQNPRLSPGMPVNVGRSREFDRRRVRGYSQWRPNHTARARRDRIKNPPPGVRITLSDNGQGMSPEVKLKLLQPFKVRRASVRIVDQQRDQ
jgi:hypothetical protein